MLRSQIDCKAERSGVPFVFDLKTRAIFPIRMDVDNYHVSVDGGYSGQKYKDFKFKSTFGGTATWEKEYFDLIKSAFLKWR
jgi:hypothetical protein